MCIFVCLFISVGANAEKTKREYVEELLHATKEVHMLDEVLYNINSSGSFRGAAIKN
tara:strand:+ start:1330 stop:1500 length:171 start_codon:yes stop_codon:yes gene_type:complete